MTRTSAATVLAIAIAACGTQDPSCEPGQIQTCICAGGGLGTQVCAEGGAAWSPCDCGEADTSTDEAHDTAHDTGEDGAPDLPTDGPCTADGDCDDGLYCNGQETCVDGACAAGTPVVCDDGDDCTTDRCDESTMECVFGYRDEDDDGFVDAACGGDDCDDSRDDVHPGHTDEDCLDGIDQGCDGLNGPMVVVRGLAAPPDASTPLVWADGATAVASPERIEVRDGDFSVVGSLSIEAGHVATPAWSGSRFGFAWAGTTLLRINVATMAGDGATSGDVETFADGGPSSPRMDWTGSEYAVFWHGPDAMLEHMALHVQRLAGDGSPVGSEIEVLETDGWPRDVVWTGAQHLVFLDDGTVQRVDGDGVWTGEVWEIPWSLECPALGVGCVAWTGSEVGVIMSGADLEIVRLAADGAPASSPVTVTSAATPDAPCHLDWTGSELAAVWLEPAGPSTRIMLGRYTPEATAIEPAVELETLGWSYDQPVLDLEWSGDAWDLVYLDETGSPLHSLVGWCD